jgi:hypothetical protein
VRVLRPLKTLNKLKGLRVIVLALLRALPELAQALLLLLFLFTVFSIIGVQVCTLCVCLCVSVCVCLCVCVAICVVAIRMGAIWVLVDGRHERYLTRTWSWLRDSHGTCESASRCGVCVGYTCWYLPCTRVASLVCVSVCVGWDGCLECLCLCSDASRCVVDWLGTMS